MTLSWLEIDARWPGASVLWDRDVAGEGWEPVFAERDGVLWAVDVVSGTQCEREIDPWERAECRCRVWEPTLKEWWTHARWDRIQSQLKNFRIVSAQGIGRMFLEHTRDGVTWERASGFDLLPQSGLSAVAEYREIERQRFAAQLEQPRCRGCSSLLVAGACSNLGCFAEQPR